MDGKRGRDADGDEASSKRTRVSPTKTSTPARSTQDNMPTATPGRAEIDSQPDERKAPRRPIGALPPTPTPTSSLGLGSSSGGSDRGSKGLRHFSLRVCQKVEEKGSTTYNEVADELVAELTSSKEAKEHGFDQKNIRRRVYDALNVLMAMDIIRKDKKEIRWVGLPTNSMQEVNNLEREKHERQQAINNKIAHWQELLMQRIALKNLMDHNAELEGTTEEPDPTNCVFLPFILVKTDQSTVIDCDMSADKAYYHFRFKGPFEIKDDIEVLSQMGMNKCKPSEVQAMVPSDMISFLPERMQRTDRKEQSVPFEPLPAAAPSSPVSSPIKAMDSSPTRSLLASSPLREPMTSPRSLMTSSSPSSSPYKR